MTHKEENIVNITVKAMELLNAGKIRQDEEQGFIGFTQEIISLAERFEKEYGHIDFNAGEHDYWETIDEFSEKELLALYAQEPEQDFVAGLHIIGTNGTGAYFRIDTEYGLYQAAYHLSDLTTMNIFLGDQIVAFMIDAADAVSHMSCISAEEFDALVSERMSNTGRVVGVYEMDFDSCVFSAVHIMDGWTSWQFSDVLDAKLVAENSNDKLRVLTEELQGKQLAYYTHPASDIVQLSKLSLEEQMQAAEQKTQHTTVEPCKEPER